MATTLVAAASAEEFKLNLKGATYTKWLWGTQRNQGSLYNFTTVPGEGYGDNGQGSELELLVDTRRLQEGAVYARLHSRFSQNFWTNGGGWGGSNPPTEPCVEGNCGEFDSRSNQYVKLRGVAVTFTPGYTWLDTAVIGANNWGMFDPYVVGRHPLHRPRQHQRPPVPGLGGKGVHLRLRPHLAVPPGLRTQLEHRQVPRRRRRLRRPGQVQRELDWSTSPASSTT